MVRFIVVYKALKLNPAVEHMIQRQTDYQMTGQRHIESPLGSPRLSGGRFYNCLQL
jgi:hypothetical protein